MNFVNSTSFASSFAWACPVRACAVAGRIGRISSTSCCGVVPSFAATEISSNCPMRSSSDWAVGMVKTVNVAEPMELTSPYCARPTSLNSRTGWRVAILIVSPILYPCSSAVVASMTTSFEPCGQVPSRSFRGLNWAWDGSRPNPNEGAPPVSTAFPFGCRIFVAESSATSPVAASTSGSARI
jgi:hypothetical protein